jgi:hypothetical protein
MYVKIQQQKLYVTMELQPTYEGTFKQTYNGNDRRRIVAD